MQGYSTPQRGGVRRKGNLHKLLYQNTYDEVLSVRDTVFGGRVLKEGKVKGDHRLGH